MTEPLKALQSGDVLVFENMSFLFSSWLINLVTDEHYGHAAIVLDDGELAVFEAWPPECRRIPLNEYLALIAKWAHQKYDWRERNDRWLKCEVWRYFREPIPPDVLAEMVRTAQSMLGVNYSMVLNWLFKLPSLHCIEYVLRTLWLEGFGLLPTLEEEPSRTDPSELRVLLRNNGFNLEFVISGMPED